MSFSTLSKQDWRLILLNSSKCEAALNKFSDITKVKTIGDWTADFYGKHWESDQNVVTAQLLRLGFCSVPKNHRLNTLFMKNFNLTRHNVNDSSKCFKGQGYGECRSYNLGNTWYGEVGGCSWYHHWYPLELLQSIVHYNQEEEFMRIFEDHLMHNEHLERIFFDHRKPYW